MKLNNREYKIMKVVSLVKKQIFKKKTLKKTSTDIIQYKDRGKLIKDFFLVFFDKSYWFKIYIKRR